MNHLPDLEAAFAGFRAAAEGADAQLRMAATVLGNAITAAREGCNAARVADIEFALNDAAAMADDLGVAPAEIAAMRASVESLKESTALPREARDQIRALQTKLRARRAAIERETFVQGGSGQPLPHPIAELQRDAAPIRQKLAEAGYATPALDAVLESTEDLRFHQLTETLDELETI